MVALARAAWQLPACACVKSARTRNRALILERKVAVETLVGLSGVVSVDPARSTTDRTVTHRPAAGL
jgi:hypothetical protein